MTRPGLKDIGIILKHSVRVSFIEELSAKLMFRFFFSHTLCRNGYDLKVKAKCHINTLF